MEEIRLRLTGGDEPLIMHNGLLADPAYGWTQKLKLVTGKRKKTEADHLEIAELEFQGSLYMDRDDGPYVPGMNIRRSVLDAARISRDGKLIERGLVTVSMVNRLDYPGPRTREELWADERFRHRVMVVVERKRIARVRPAFYGWSLECTLTYNDSVINSAALAGIARTAGSSIGLCDGRPFYGGRFEVEVINQ